MEKLTPAGNHWKTLSNTKTNGEIKLPRRDRAEPLRRALATSTFRDEYRPRFAIADRPRSPSDAYRRPRSPPIGRPSAGGLIATDFRGSQHGRNTLCKPLVQRREFVTHGYDNRYSASRGRAHRWHAVDDKASPFVLNSVCILQTGTSGEFDRQHVN